MIVCLHEPEFIGRQLGMLVSIPRIELAKENPESVVLQIPFGGCAVRGFLKSEDRLPLSEWSRSVNYSHHMGVSNRHRRWYHQPPPYKRKRGCVAGFHRH